MSDLDHAPAADYLAQVCDLVSAYVANNAVPAAELSALIRMLHASLLQIASSHTCAAPEAGPAGPIEKPSAARIRKSVSEDALVSFIDGRNYKTLKRHLTAHGLSPEQYRSRYGLPADYPMVAPSYAARRSALAKEIGLGRPGAMSARAKTRDDV